MRPRIERFEVVVDLRTTLNDLKEKTTDDHFPLGTRNVPESSPSDIAEFNARERRLFDALRRHGPSLDAWLAHAAFANCVYRGIDGFFDDDVRPEKDYARLSPAVPAEYRPAVDRMVHVHEFDPMPHYPLYGATSAEVVSARLIPHGPPSRLEGPVAIPFVTWHHLLLTVEAKTTDLEPESIDRSWQDLEAPIRALVGSKQRFTDHLQAMFEAACRDDVVHDFIVNEHVRGACASLDDSLIDPDAGDRILRARLATLSQADRDFYARFADDDAAEEDWDTIPLYEALFGIAPTITEVESHRIHRA